MRSKKKRKDRYNIYIDDEFRFGVDENTLIRFDLQKGKEIGEEEIENIENEEVVVKAFNSAIRSLKLRDHSEKEIKDKLRQKEFNNSVIEKAIAKLYKLDFLNDERFARIWVSDRIKLKPKGKKALEIELKQKGVHSNIIEKVLEKSFGENGELELAKKVFAKADKKYSGLGSKEKKQKITEYMMRKGFRWGEVEKAFENPDS